MTDVVLFDVSERIATVTLNRPEARNALSSELLRRLPETLVDADGRDDVDVVILTGTDPAFCAGLDLKELGSTAGNLGSVGDGRRGPFPAMTKPVIGAVNGAAITGGLEVALACDFLVASDRARFGDTHSRVGVMPGWGLTVLLPQAIGLRRAREMSYSGNFLTADEALAVGAREPRGRPRGPVALHAAARPRHHRQRPARRSTPPGDLLQRRRRDGRRGLGRGGPGREGVGRRGGRSGRGGAAPPGDHGARPRSALMVRHGRRCARPSAHSCGLELALPSPPASRLR